jgi:hypothetical protein
MTSSLDDFEELPVESSLPHQLQSAARLSAARMLRRQSDKILKTVEAAMHGETEYPIGSLEFARNCLDAVGDPQLEMGTCPDDGTPVTFDFSIKEYCCAMRHCPPD